MTDFLFCQINKVNCELDRVRSMINDRLETEKTKVEKFLVELREERHRVRVYEMSIASSCRTTI